MTIEFAFLRSSSGPTALSLEIRIGAIEALMASIHELTTAIHPCLFPVRLLGLSRTELRMVSCSLIIWDMVWTDCVTTLLSDRREKDLREAGDPYFRASGLTHTRSEVSGIS